MTTPLTDIHIHAPPFEGPGGPEILRPTPLENLFSAYLKRRLGISSTDPDPNGTYLKNLARDIRNSESIEKGVVLPMDGVYDAKGELDRERTRFMVSSDTVFDSIKPYPELLPGASVNPLRKDAIDDLERCAERGAVLVKVLPNTQGFDPSDKSLKPFWKKMADLGLPLLSHSGYEFALPVVDQSFGDPARLLPALEEGVTVVAAHGGSTGILVYEKYTDTVRGLLRGHPNFFLDLSATTLPTRAGMLLGLRDMPEAKGKLLFGSDYPVPAFTFPFIFSMPPGTLLTIRGEKNLFDRLFALFSALGLELSDGPFGRPEG
ncbi:MAG: amidohydrolase family protein [Thermodesulfobacteriota bacterium]